MTKSNLYGAPRTLIDADYHRVGKDLIHPFDHERVQPASYDATLGPKLLRPRAQEALRHRLDLRETKPASLMESCDIGDAYVLRPGRAVLVATAEQVTCPLDMVCSVDGKSTIGRCFVAVHVTAGFVDPGFIGVVTLELVNHGPWEFVLYTGMKICQFRFTWLQQHVHRPYGSPGLGSHYQGSLDVRAAETETPIEKPHAAHYCEGCD